MTPEKILNAAIQAVTGRMENHGAPSKTFADIAARWSVTLGVPVTAHQVALCLIDLKIVRANNDPQHMDNAVDIAGYASLLGELVPNPTEAEKEKVDAVGTVPLVCDFLTQRLIKEGDVLIDSMGVREAYLRLNSGESYPVQTGKNTWSASGWLCKSDDGNRMKLHIIRIERDGVVVAEGQRYDD